VADHSVLDNVQTPRAARLRRAALGLHVAHTHHSPGGGRSIKEEEEEEEEPG
jgi:hypothetical protein